jgi:hypothetical protein
MSEDRKWQQRVRLSGLLLLESFDCWCRGQSEFPIERTIASVLYLLSARCDPFGMRENRICEQLSESVTGPVDEYSKTWPGRFVADAFELVNALSQILVTAVEQWNEGKIDPAVESVNQQIVEQVVARKYVVFRHNETTGRDYGGFYGSR